MLGFIVLNSWPFSSFPSVGNEVMLEFCAVLRGLRKRFVDPFASWSVVTGLAGPQLVGSNKVVDATHILDESYQFLIIFVVWAEVELSQDSGSLETNQMPAM